MTFTGAIADGFQKYVTFSGRSSRAAYWWWTLFAVILAIIANIIDLAIGSPVTSAIVALGLLLPGLAVAIRRLHDVGRSGWWILIGLIPLVGAIVLIVFAVTPSDGPNAYGTGPDTQP